MKTYIVYFNGIACGTIKATSHNEAEKKAKAIFEKRNKKTPEAPPIENVSVAYTEL